MKKNPYYLTNKTERALNLLIYYGPGAVVVPYVNLRHVSWSETVKMEFSSVRVEFTPPEDFDIKEFLESIREQWLFELREEGDLDIDVDLGENSIANDQEEYEEG